MVLTMLSPNDHLIPYACSVDSIPDTISPPAKPSLASKRNPKALDKLPIPCHPSTTPA
jgi:hypothetical protein